MEKVLVVGSGKTADVLGGRLISHSKERGKGVVLHDCNTDSDIAKKSRKGQGRRMNVIAVAVGETNVVNSMATNLSVQRDAVDGNATIEPDTI